MTKNPSLTMRFQDNFEADYILRHAQRHIAQAHAHLGSDGLLVWDAVGLLAASIIDAKLIALRAEFKELEAEHDARKAARNKVVAHVG